MKVIGVIGARSRDSGWDFLAVKEKFLSLYEKGDTICSGLCPKGGDRFALILQEEMSLPHIWHLPDWEKYGRAAGFVRNGLIARDSDVLIACVSFGRAGGTEDTIRKFIKMHGGKGLHLV